MKGRVGEEVVEEEAGEEAVAVADAEALVAEGADEAEGEGLAEAAAEAEEADSVEVAVGEEALEVGDSEEEVGGHKQFNRYRKTQRQRSFVYMNVYHCKKEQWMLQ
jgi:hypothetical protein